MCVGLSHFCLNQNLQNLRIKFPSREGARRVAKWAGWVRRHAITHQTVMASESVAIPDMLIDDAFVYAMLVIFFGKQNDPSRLWPREA